MDYNSILHKSTETIKSSLATINECDEKGILFDGSVLESVVKMSNVQYTLFKLDNETRNKIFRSLASVLIEADGISTILNLFDSMTSRFVNEEYPKMAIDICSCIASLFHNFTDPSEKFGKKLCEMDSFFETFIRLLKQLFQYNSNSDFDGLIRSVMAIPYNCLIHGSTENISRMREKEILQSVQPYLKVKNKNKVKLHAFLICAYVATEEESALYLAEKDLIDYLIGMLKKSVCNGDHEADGSSSIELAKGVECLAKNEKNKILLVQQGLIPVLKLMTKSTMVEERELSFLIIWTLAFNKDNKNALWKEFRSVLECPAKQNSFQKGKFQHDEKFKRLIDKSEHARKGALFVLEPKVQPSSSGRAPTSEEKQSKGHIMISYCHRNREIAEKINDELVKRKFKTWIDKEEMKGSALDAMAKAVENASVVLIFMSNDYKSSQYCETEASYAYEMKKSIIPIRAEPCYCPDGWLGALKAMKTYYDFSGKYSYEEILDKFLIALQKELNLHNMDDLEMDIKPSKAGTSHSAHVASPSKVVAPTFVNWSSDDVQHWMTDNGIKKLPSDDSISGEELVYLKKLLEEDPKSFNAEVNSMFTNIHDKAAFRKLIENV